MDYYLSIAGGSEKTNYSVSLNHFREDNFIPNDNYKRYSIKTNIDSKVRKWLDLGNSTFLSYTLLNRARESIITSSRWWNPMIRWVTL